MWTPSPWGPLSPDELAWCHALFFAVCSVFVWISAALVASIFEREDDEKS